MLCVVVLKSIDCMELGRKKKSSETSWAICVCFVWYSVVGKVLEQENLKVNIVKYISSIVNVLIFELSRKNKYLASIL